MLTNSNIFGPARPKKDPLLGFLFSKLKNLPIVLVNIWLALFNLIPLAPLDGSKVLLGLAPSSWQGSLMVLESPPSGGGVWGFLIALFLAMTFLPYLSGFVFKLLVG